MLDQARKEDPAWWLMGRGSMSTMPWRCLALYDMIDCTIGTDSVYIRSCFMRLLLLMLIDDTRALTLQS